LLTETEQRRRAVALGDVIRRRRREVGHTQESLAEAAGCERQTIQRLENAAHSTLVSNLENVADALGWSAAELFDARDQLLAERRQPRRRPS
jgi:transcriptional regulator with XRE-family HTH domain